MRAAALHYSLLRRLAKGFTRTVYSCVVLLACLAQLWMSAQYRHATAFAAHAMVSGAGAEASRLTLLSIDAGQPGVPCALHGAHANSHQGNGPPPCNNGDCPCCPFCPCCAAIHAAMGILPQEVVRADYAPFVSTFAAPPAVLGLITRFVAFAGQPRAPPVLI